MCHSLLLQGDASYDFHQKQSNILNPRSQPYCLWKVISHGVFLLAKTALCFFFKARLQESEREVETQLFHLPYFFLLNALLVRISCSPAPAYFAEFSLKCFYSIRLLLIHRYLQPALVVSSVVYLHQSFQLHGNWKCVDSLELFPLIWFFLQSKHFNIFFFVRQTHISECSFLTTSIWIFFISSLHSQRDNISFLCWEI